MSTARLVVVFAGVVLLAFAGLVVWRVFALHDVAASGASHSESLSEPQPVPAFGTSHPETSSKDSDIKSPRIVALSPAIGIILRDLGKADLVVGRHGYDTFLPSSIPTCGDQAGIDFERLLRVSPTHIFTQWGTRELPERLKTLSNEHSWIVADYPLLTLEDIRSATLDLDRQIGRWPQTLDAHSPSTQAATLIEEMNRAWTQREGIFKGRVLLLASLKPYGVFGPGSCHHEILLALGAMPAVMQGAMYINLDAEKIIELAPDAILYLDPLETQGPPRVEPFTLSIGNRPFAGPAMVLRDPESQIPSTSMIRTANLIAQALEQMQSTRK